MIDFVVLDFVYSLIWNQLIPCFMLFGVQLTFSGGLLIFKKFIFNSIN